MTSLQSETEISSLMKHSDSTAEQWQQLDSKLMALHMSRDPESEHTSQASTCSPDEIYDEFLKALAVQDGLNEFTTKIDEYLNKKIIVKVIKLHPAKHIVQKI